MRRHGQLMAFSGHKLDGSKNYRNLLQEHETESYRQKQGKMNSVANRRLQKFTTWEIPRRNLALPQHWNNSKTQDQKIDEKRSLKVRKFTKIK